MTHKSTFADSKLQQDVTKYGEYVQFLSTSNPLYSRKLPVFYASGETQNERANKIYDILAEDVFFVKLKSLVLRRLFVTHDLADTNEAMTRKIASIIEDVKVKQTVCNAAVSVFEKSLSLQLYHSVFDGSGLCRAKAAADEPVLCIRETRMAWEQGINEELQAMATEMKRPFARKLESGKHPLLESSVPVSARENVRFLFDSEDLLETATSIRNPNSTRFAIDRTIGLLKVSLVTPTIHELSKRLKKKKKIINFIIFLKFVFNLP